MADLWRRRVVWEATKGRGLSGRRRVVTHGEPEIVAAATAAVGIAVAIAVVAIGEGRAVRI